MQCSGMADLLLFEVVVVAGSVDIQTGIRPNTAALNSVTVRLVEGDKRALEYPLGEGESRDPPDGLDCDFARLLELGPERAKFGRRRDAVEAADSYIDRMNFAAAENPHEVVACRLEL